jgi:gas vesicle protein
MSRPTTTGPLAAALPLGLRLYDGDTTARLVPARLFSPAVLGKTDDFRAALNGGSLGRIDATSARTAPRAQVQYPERASASRTVEGAMAIPPERGALAMGNGVAAEREAASTDKIRQRDNFLERARELLSPSGIPTESRFGVSASDATYDFDEYVMLRDAAARGAGGGSGTFYDPRFALLRSEAGNGIASFLDYAMIGLSGIELQKARANAGALRELLLSFWTTYCGVRAYNRLAQFPRGDIAAAANGLSPEAYYGVGLGFSLSSVAQDEATEYLLSDGASGLEAELTQAFWLQILDAVFVNYFAQIPAATGMQPDYDFDPFATDEVLFGVRVIHRQTWRLLGYARGELVKTIPLGPRESQKVSVRILRRRKVARTSEEATSFETSQESGQTTKDTAEVVSEASEKTAKNLSAEVSGGYAPFFQAKVSGSLSSDIAESSKETNSRLNEKMQKTASRMKRDTKVTVSTEIETTFEENRSSELVNPNDEVAVTYMYHRLQQRHWVSTEVGEVHSVVFVPEPLPPTIDEAWVRRHADAILGALLDPAFAPLVQAIRDEPTTLPRIPPAEIARFQAALQAGIDATNRSSTFSGARDLPDMLGAGQAAFERQIDRETGFDVDEARRRYRSQVLFDHIRRNILHYLRTIVLEEDRDQRTQRLSRLLVPTQWTFVPSGPIPPVGPAVPGEVQGEFKPIVGTERPVSEVIDPTGPVGFILNCAVYRLRSEPRLANLHEALAYLRSQYMRFDLTLNGNAAAASLTVRQFVVHTPRNFTGSFTIIYRQGRGLWLLEVLGRSEMDWPPVAVRPDDGALDILGVMLWLEGQPTDGAAFQVQLVPTGQLEDPHLKLVRIQYPAPRALDEAQVFTEVLQRDMLNIVPELEGDGLVVGPWADLTARQQEGYRREYHRYLMLREAGRLVPLDTANLVLELEVSRTPALEPFKRLHRYVDVLSAYEETLRRSLDNQRRTALLDEGEFADPDIDRVTVVAGSAAAGSLVVVPAEGGGNSGNDNPEA